MEHAINRKLRIGRRRGLHASVRIGGRGRVAAEIGGRKLRVSSGWHPGALLVLGLAAGAIAGATALLALAPGSDPMRRALRSRARHLRDLVADLGADVEDRIAAVRDRRAGRIPAREEPDGPFDFPAG